MNGNYVVTKRFFGALVAQIPQTKDGELICTCWLEIVATFLTCAVIKHVKCSAKGVNMLVLRRVHVGEHLPILGDGFLCLQRHHFFEKRFRRHPYKAHRAVGIETATMEFGESNVRCVWGGGEGRGRGGN